MNIESKKDISKYEKEQIDAIEKWKKEKPSTVNKALGYIAAPVVWVVQKVVPDAAIQGVLTAANYAAYNLSDTSDIKREAKINDIVEMKSKNLELCDSLVNSVHNWAICIAVAEGGVTGATGLPGIAADIPAIITLALRSIHKIGLCYGYECHSEVEKNFIFGILSVSSSNSVKEKAVALATLRSIQVTITKQTWKSMTRKVGIESGIIAIRNLAKQLGINLTKRKAAQVIPVVGAGVGASVNGWYINDVCWAAKRSFQERWLRDNQKINK